MAKLSKVETRNHNAALELLAQDVLSETDRDFVLQNYHEAATHVNGLAGAFFTPYELAFDAVLEFGICDSERPFKVLDLCSGIGMLSYAVQTRYPNADITCVEINSAYIEVGKKLVPSAKWIHADVTDADAMRWLGQFDFVISNPPFGRVATFKDKVSPGYEGGEAEFKVIDLASTFANYGVFILPQQSSGFQYSGVRCYERRESAKYKKFEEDTGIHLEIGIGLDTTVYEGWKGVNPLVEVACVDFKERKNGGQVDLFLEAQG